MKTKSLLFLVLVLLTCFSPTGSAAPLGTTFNYQGRLTDGGKPAEGLFDFQFAVFDVESGGSGVGQGRLVARWHFGQGP
jgi:hypothetical protein